jgi:hypothetical protein
LISAYGPKVLVERDHAIADFRWPLATVLVAVAVAIVGVVGSGQHRPATAKRAIAVSTVDVQATLWVFPQ